MRRSIPPRGLFDGRIKAVMVVMFGLLLCACNNDLERTLKADYGESGTDYQTGKVLLIVVDGAGGKAVQKAINASQAPNIKGLINNSMYTFEGLADSRSTLPAISNERGWANLLTGVTTHSIGN